MKSTKASTGVKQARKARKARGAKRPKPRTDHALHDLNLAAGFLVGKRRMASLAEVLDPAVPTLSLHELSHTELAKLVAHRLRRTAANRLYFRMLGAPGLIDNEAAIREVVALSPVGLALMDVERRLIRMMMEGEPSK